MLGVSPSAYYAWRRRPSSARARYDTVLLERIRDRHVQSAGLYGAPRIRADLAEEGHHVATKRVARLMRGAALAGGTRRRGAITTTPGSERAAPELVERDFTATAPDQLWCADATYVATWAGWLYLAVVIDVSSRRVVGWHIAEHLRTELMRTALEQAIAERCPQGVIHHSDQGCKYTSIAFGERCCEAGIRPSTGSAGDCFDNTLAESFFATLECEWLKRRSLRSKAEGYRALFQFIEGWYNPRRRHSALRQRAPVEYERLAAPTGSDTAPKHESVH